MSVNVVERLMHRIFKAPNLLPGETLSKDRWESGEAFKALKSKDLETGKKDTNNPQQAWSKSKSREDNNELKKVG